MDPYLLLKFVHVGHGDPLGRRRLDPHASRRDPAAPGRRRGDHDRHLLRRAPRQPRVRPRRRLATILTGLTLGWLGGWFWAAWTVLAIAIVAGTFVLGAHPSSARPASAPRRTLAAGDLPGAMTLGRKVLRLVALDLGAQWAIIALMVLKPGWTDPALAIPAALLATRRPRGRAAPAAAGDLRPASPARAIPGRPPPGGGPDHGPAAILGDVAILGGLLAVLSWPSPPSGPSPGPQALRAAPERHATPDVTRGARFRLGGGRPNVGAWHPPASSTSASIPSIRSSQARCR